MLSLCKFGKSPQATGSRPSDNFWVEKKRQESQEPHLSSDTEAKINRELFETRITSLSRFLFTVILFHEVAKFRLLYTGGSCCSAVFGSEENIHTCH